MILLTIAEFSERVGISRASGYALVRSRGIEHIAHPHGRILIPEEAVTVYLESIRIRPRRSAGLRVPAPPPINHDAVLERSRLEALESVRERRTR